MWLFVSIILAALLAVLLARYYMLKLELGRMASAMGEVHRSGGNRQLTIGTQQPQLARLATAVNVLYDDIDADRAANRTAMDEMRQSLTNISHDLRTPLTSILGYIKLLQGGANTPQQEISYLDIARQKAETLNQLVGGLFELARLESGGYAFRHERLDANTLLAEELAGIYTQMQEKDVLPQVHLPEAPLWVIADRDALGRVFANLLGNMARHGQAPMQVWGGTEDKMVVFRFSNKASSLSPGDIDQLFNRFFTADRMRSGKDTGLGLAIVKEFVDQMNGSISAGLKDETLTFTLLWPQV